MSGEAYRVPCAACRGAVYNAYPGQPDEAGVVTYSLVCPCCGDCSAVQEVPDGVQPTAEEAVHMPSGIPCVGALELDDPRDDPVRPDGKAESEFYEANERTMGQSG